MKKIATALFLTVFFTGLGFCEDNLGRAVYAVYSENFNGLKYVDIGDTPWDPGSIDNVHIYAWGSYQDGFLSTATYSSFSERLDGNTYWQLKGFGAAYGGGANFISNPVRMIEYANGTYEFYARASTDDVLDIRIGMSSVYSAVGEKLMTLRSAGLTANGQWQKIVIPLATLGINELALYDGIIYPFLFSVPASVSASSALDLDCIVIKKASGGSFSATIKNVDSSDSTTPENITWGNDALGNRWYAAKQYIELNLDILPTYSSTVGTSSPVTIVNWGIQLYTEVKNSTPAYTGELTADDASGMIWTTDTALMLPMCWRMTDKTLPYAGNSAVEDDYSQTLVIGFNEGGLYDAGSNAPKKDEYYCWSAMKDSDMFGGNADIYNGCDYVRVWDQKGIHTAAGDANYWGVYPTAAEKTITPKIYFGADFGTAFTPMEYSVNSLTIELFYE